MKQVINKALSKRFTALDVVSAEQAEALVHTFGSPLYVYKEDIIVNKVGKLLHTAKGFKVSYALKANTNSHIVRLIRELGVDHVDVVSPG